jgi:hypothetical protein
MDVPQVQPHKTSLLCIQIISSYSKIEKESNQHLADRDNPSPLLIVRTSE